MSAFEHVQRTAPDAIVVLGAVLLVVGGGAAIGRAIEWMEKQFKLRK